MRTVRGLEGYGSPRPCAVTWGVFDGVHAGHRALLAAVREEAGSDGPAVAVVFDWHPNAVLGRPVPPWLVDPEGTRMTRLEAAGVDVAIRLPFDAALAARSAREFLREVVAGRLGARAAVLGERARFGRGGEGTGATLLAEAPPLGIRARLVPPAADAYGEVSSTRIRAAVRDGDLAAAAAGLGEPYAIEGTVVRGQGRGATLGFPTANLATGAQALPPPGVYIGWAGWAGAEGKRWPALANLGRRPTFETDGALTCEVHLDGFHGDLTGRRLAFACLHRLRGERRFDSPQALADQIRRDREALRGIGESSPPPL